MFINGKWVMLMNEADDGTDMDAGVADAAETVDTTPDIASIRAEMAETAKGYQGLQAQIQSLQPKLELVNKMESLFTGGTKEAKPFEEGISMTNVAEAAEHALKSGELTNEEVRELREEMAQIKQKNAEADYQTATLELNEVWMDRFGDETSYNNALGMIEKANPQLANELEKVEAGQASGVDFVRKVNSALESLLVRELLNPDSEVAKSVNARTVQRAALRDSSVIEGEGKANPNGQTQDSYIKVTYS